MQFTILNERVTKWR